MTDRELIEETDRLWLLHKTKCWIDVRNAVEDGDEDSIAEFCDATSPGWCFIEPEKGDRCQCGQMTWEGQTCRPTLPAEFESDRTPYTDDDIPF